ncbi:LacI family transcriptional regulator [Mycetocola manganoxydans]|uniref:LacI family transcriptional regulator n=1 Tax=Mycetocola manganoxydans TaxID=699879 RepID=A0A3L6ZUL4_9MICO|nr:LacI family DNA-binding transcriptional regulator [Mycetocola manganoxydans]RLP71345.1 LacI family transcriptional regulator [Mycetocola manganoxydans]GHD45922.1 LacI family transcriptional regulator [Mycetocola manganoxydans]
MSIQSQSPTLEMVAARAGVSRATVSRVVNASPKVTAEVAAIVHSAIAELNYVPNRAARSLASRKTQVIALVVPESTAKVFADPFFASVVQGVALHLAETDYTLNLLIASETKSDKTRRYLLGGNVDGALVVSHHSGDHSYTDLGQKLPIVFGGRPISRDSTLGHYVDVDNVSGARVATEHLIGRGCRSIATIAGPQDMPPGLDRLRGWRDAMASAGLDDSLVEYGDYSPDDGAAAMRRILARGVPIDGLFAFSDQLAAGAYAVIREAGLSIPGDIAVVGYDDDRYAATVSPTLTTVNQAPVEMGAKMAEIIVRLIDGEEVDRATIMPTRLVLRESA